MSIPAQLERLNGNWQGKNLLWLTDTPIVTTTTAVVRSAAGGACLNIEYVWSYEGEAQEGILLLGSEGADEMKGIWRDSFHSNDDFMISEGKVDESGVTQILGHYSAPPGPDWGWKTLFRSKDTNHFEIEMINISPEGEEAPAVRMEFERA